MVEEAEGGQLCRSAPLARPRIELGEIRHELSPWRYASGEERVEAGAVSGTSILGPRRRSSKYACHIDTASAGEGNGPSALDDPEGGPDPGIRAHPPVEARSPVSPGKPLQHPFGTQQHDLRREPQGSRHESGPGRDAPLPRRSPLARGKGPDGRDPSRSDVHASLRSQAPGQGSPASTGDRELGSREDKQAVARGRHGHEEEEHHDQHVAPLVARVAHSPSPGEVPSLDQSGIHVDHIPPPHGARSLTSRKRTRSRLPSMPEGPGKTSGVRGCLPPLPLL